MMQTERFSEVLILIPEILVSGSPFIFHSNLTGRVPRFKLHVMSKLSPSPRSGGINNGCKTGAPPLSAARNLVINVSS